MLDKLSKKQKIFQAAEELFAKYGLKKVSIDEIVDRAGVAKGTFYLYYRNKEQLYEQIFRCYQKQICENKIRIMNDPEKDLRTKFYENIIWSLYFLKKNVILRELLADNPNYTSDKINIRTLTVEEFSKMKSDKNFCKGDISKLRKDMTIEDLIRVNSFLVMLLKHEKDDPEYFPRFLDLVAKIWVDGMLSDYKWPDMKINNLITKFNNKYGTDN